MKVQTVKNIYDVKKERKPLEGKGKRTVETKNDGKFEQYLFEFLDREEENKTKNK